MAAACFASTSREFVNALGQRQLLSQRQSIRAAHSRARPAIKKHLQQNVFGKPKFEGKQDPYYVMQDRATPLPAEIRPHPAYMQDREKPYRRLLKKGGELNPVEIHHRYVPGISQATHLWNKPKGVAWAAIVRSLIRHTIHLVYNKFADFMIKGVLKRQGRGPKRPSATDPSTWLIAHPDYFPRKLRRFKAIVSRQPTPPEHPVFQYKIWQELALPEVEEQYHYYLQALASGTEEALQDLARFEPTEVVMHDLRRTIAARNSERVSMTADITGVELIATRFSRRPANVKKYPRKVEQHENSALVAQILLRFRSQQTRRTYPQNESSKAIVSDGGVTLRQRVPYAQQEQNALEAVQEESREVLQYFVFQRNLGTYREVDERQWYMMAEVFEDAAYVSQEELDAMFPPKPETTEAAAT